MVVPIVLAAAFGLYHRHVTTRLRREIGRLDQEVANLRRTEEMLHTKEAPYRGVVASLPVALFTLSEGKGLVALGLEPGKIVGRSVFETYRDTPQITEDVRLALGGKSARGLRVKPCVSPKRESRRPEPAPSCSPAAAREEVP